jgi:hypothetical protein
MPALTPIRRLLAALGLALAALSLASVAEAKTVEADVRVVDSSGKTLVEQTQFTPTGSTRVKTDPRADCFGPGTGGSGDRATIPGPTALGQLAETTRTDRDAKPLSITDAFDFGLGLCGIGDAVSPQTGFWYLKLNGTGSQTGGDQTPVDDRDSVLWYLVEDFNDPVPDELVLNTPNRINDDGEVRVSVTRIADDGKSEPAVGATVTGAAEPTDADGKTVASTGAKVLEMRATLDGTIPSNLNSICTRPAKDCPPGYAETIAGTGKADVIEAGRPAETIRAGGGDDKIVSSAGKGPDLIKCGGGEDRLTLSGPPAKTSVGKGCEKVRGGGKVK